MKTVAFLAVTVLTAGCATPIFMSSASDESIRGSTAFVLCSSYGLNGHDRLRAEIDRRGLIDPEDWSMVAREKVHVGMSECAMLASWGPPDDMHRSVGGWGVHVQWVYGRQYVYTENGTVTSWSD